jgi:hypothetical protein
MLTITDTLRFTANAARDMLQMYTSKRSEAPPLEGVPVPSWEVARRIKVGKLARHLGYLNEALRETTGSKRRQTLARISAMRQTMKRVERMTLKQAQELSWIPGRRSRARAG